MPLMLVNSEQ